MDKIVSQLDSISRMPGVLGENGAPAVASLGDHFLEIFSKELTRGSTPRLELNSTSTKEDIVTAVVLAFYARSIKNGSGERLIFYQMFGDLLAVFPSVMLGVTKFIPNPDIGGSWNDLNRLVEYLSYSHPRRDHFRVGILSFREHVANLYADQLQADCNKAIVGDLTGLSLAAKWAPSEKTHFWKILGSLIAKRLYSKMYLLPAVYHTVNSNYRKVLSLLRKVLQVVEVKMCANTWADINFSRVPGIAMRQYGRFAFPNKTLTGEDRSRLSDRITCAERFADFKTSVSKGESKIHGSTVGLHQYGIEFEVCLDDSSGERSQLLELQFADLLDTLRKNNMGEIDISKLIPIVDVSGSMTCSIAGEVTAMSIAIQLGLILSQLDNTSHFYNRVITFSEDPVWVNMSRNPEISYLSKYKMIKSSQWATNTNFEKVFGLILSTAKDLKLKPEEIAGMKLIVFTDMQFDKASKRPWNTLHKELVLQFQEAGYPLPGLIYWNLAARPTEGFVVDSSQEGAIMVSGFGVGQLKAMLAGDLHTTNPLDKMYEVLSNPVFDVLRETVSTELKILM